MIRNPLLTLLTSLFAIAAIAQPNSLKIGDRMPDIFLGKFLDSSQKKMRFSEIKAKLVVLDFWNIHCTVCVADMPKMDSIEKKYNGTVKIFAVTKNSEQEVNQLFGKVKIKRPNYPFIVQDSVFSSLFPHQGDPLHVWINEKGTVLAITHFYSTNFKTIEKFLSGVDPQLSRSWDYGVNEDYPLLSEQNVGVLSRATNYSALIERFDEYANSAGIRIEKNFIQLTNATLLRLYNVAYNTTLYGFDVDNFGLGQNNRIVIAEKDKALFFPPDDQSEFADWIKRNSFGYELRLPADMTHMRFKYMQEDLDRYLPYKAKIEKRTMKCLLLSKIPSQRGLKEMKADPGSQTIIKLTSSNTTLQNVPISSLIAQLLYSNRRFQLPIVDDTDIRSNVSINLKCKLSDIECVNRELKTYGLQLIEKEKEIDMLVISDK